MYHNWLNFFSKSKISFQNQRFLFKIKDLTLSELFVKYFLNKEYILYTGSFISVVFFTVDFGSKYKKNHIPLYFVATQYLCNKALVEYMDN